MLKHVSKGAPEMNLYAERIMLDSAAKNVYYTSRMIPKNLEIYTLGEKGINILDSPHCVHNVRRVNATG